MTAARRPYSAAAPGSPPCPRPDRRQRRFGIFAGAALACAVLLSGPSPAAAETAAEVQQTIDKALAWFTTSSGGLLTLKTGRPVAVAPVSDGGFEVTLPDLQLRVVEDGGDAYRIGTVRMALKPTPTGRWELSGSLPRDLSYAPAGEPPIGLTTESSTLSMEIDPKDGMTFGADVRIDGVAAAFPDGRLTLGRVALTSHLTETGDQKWAVPSSFTMTDLAVLSVAGKPMVKIGRLAVTGNAGGSGFDRLRALQSTLNRIAGANNLEGFGLVMQVLEQLTKPTLLIGSAEGEFEIAGIEVFDDDSGSQLGHLGGGSFHAKVIDLDTDHAGLEIGYRHRDLTAPAMESAEVFVPPTAEIILALRNLPLTSAIAAVENLVKGNDTPAAAPPGTPAAAPQSPEDRAFDLLAGANATLALPSLKIIGDQIGIEANGDLRANRQSPHAAVGTLTIAVRGLEALAQSAGALSGEPVPPSAVAVIAALGERDARPDGSVVRRYRLALTESGQLFLNDNDMTPLLAELESKEEPPTDAAPTDGTPVPDAIPESTAQPPQTAALLTAFSPELLRDLLNERGFATEQRTGDNGQPILAVKPGRLKVKEMFVEFFDCSGAACDDAMIWSWFKPTGKVNLTQVNAWNAQSRWTRTYQDNDRDLRLEMDLRAVGGIGRDSVDAALGVYLDAVPDWVDHFGTARR